jgi:hypothetical protein
MITTLIAIALTGTPSLGQSNPEPKTLISGMIKHYYEAKSISGRTTSVQTALDARVTTVTEMDIRQPDCFRIAQARDGSAARSWLLVSNGTIFTYDKPDQVKGKPRFAEPLFQNGKKMTNREIYQVISGSIGDKNAAIDIAFGRAEDLRALVNLWGKEWVNHGLVSIGGRKGYHITSTMRPYVEAGYWDKVEMVIDPESNLINYKTIQKVFPPDRREAVYITTDLKVEFTLNQEIADSVFAIR